MKLKLIAIYEVFKKKYVYSLYSILSVILFILGGRDFFDMVRNETTLDFSVTHIATYIAVFVTTFNILYIFYFFKFVDDNHQFGKFINTTDLKCILALFSFGCFLSFIYLQKPIVMFFRNIDDKTWNGWVLLIWLATSFFILKLVYIGLVDLFKDAKTKLIYNQEKVYTFCVCPNCGDEIETDKIEKYYKENENIKY